VQGNEYARPAKGQPCVAEGLQFGLQSGPSLPIESALTNTPEHGRHTLITAGIVLLILAAIFNSAILWIIGGILAVLGVFFWILGAMGRAVGGRRHYY
jgi:Family of unknown function (DUF6131)